MQSANSIVFDFNREWVRLQITKSFAQVVTDHAVHNKHAISVHWRGENFAAGQIAPLVTCNDAAGFEPFEFRRQLRYELGAVGRFAGDAIDLTRMP